MPSLQELLLRGDSVTSVTVTASSQPALCRVRPWVTLVYALRDRGEGKSFKKGRVSRRKEEKISFAALKKCF